MLSFEHDGYAIDTGSGYSKTAATSASSSQPGSPWSTIRLNTNGTFTAYGYSNGERRILGKQFSTRSAAQAAIDKWKPAQPVEAKREIAVINGKAVDVTVRRDGKPMSLVYTTKSGLPKLSQWATDERVDWHLIAVHGHDPKWQAVVADRFSVLPSNEVTSTKGNRYDSADVMATIGPDVTAKDLMAKYGMGRARAYDYIRMHNSAKEA